MTNPVSLPPPTPCAPNCSLCAGGVPLVVSGNNLSSITTGGGSGIVNVPYIPSGNSSVMGTWTTTPTPPKAGACKICGKEKGYYLATITGLCKECHDSIANDFIMNKLDKILDKSEYCDTCKFHMKACECPGKKALDELANEHKDDGSMYTISGIASSTTAIDSTWIGSYGTSDIAVDPVDKNDN